MATSFRFVPLFAVAGLLFVSVCGCNKTGDTTAGAPAAGKGTPPSTITPELQTQIDATQKADAARHAAQAAGTAK